MGLINFKEIIMSESQDRPSKSQLKRDMVALQKLGEALIKLPISQLNEIPIDDQLREAILEAQSLTSHEAKRRQLQYVGRLMREVDSAPIQEALSKLQLHYQKTKQAFHQVEKWRDQLIEGNDEVLQAFFTEHPKADFQHLRQLIRNAKHKKAGADTALFRYLRDFEN